MKDCLKLNLGPYPGEVYFTTTSCGFKALNKKLNLQLEPDKWTKLGICCYNFELSRGVVAVDIDCHNINLPTQLAVIVHELQHLWEFIIKSIGEKSDVKGEHKAYMMQYLSQQCFEFFLKQRGVK